MIDNWYYGLLEAYDSACIIYGFSWLSFPASDERITSLNDIDKPVNVDPPMTVVALDSDMTPVVPVMLK